MMNPDVRKNATNNQCKMKPIKLKVLFKCSLSLCAKRETYNAHHTYNVGDKTDLCKIAQMEITIHGYVYRHIKSTERKFLKYTTV